jgi:uncharacterized iron-regulated membrane protein
MKDQPRLGAFHFAAWRWHFYAGLYVAPFLIMLAVTGLIMLWVSAMTELNGERARVAVTGDPLPVSVLAEAAVAAIPDGTAGLYIAPMAEGRVAAFRIDNPAGQTTVLVNPYTAQVVQVFPWRDGWYDWATRLHGTLLIGNVGDVLIEIAASLGLILIATGLYLWWPRRSALPDTAARGRGWWRSMHGTAGVWVAAMLVVFLISGLSWAGVWGAKFVQAWNTFPAAKWDQVPLSDMTHASMNHGGLEVPWTLEQTPMPASGSDAGTAGVAAPVTVDGVAALAAGLGLPGRFQISWPAGEAGVWTVSHDSMSNDGPDPTADRTIHIDRFTGHVLADVRYADYSPYAQAMAWGIAFHEGDLGGWNLALNTVFCLGVIFLSVSGLAMWWLRRPAGLRLGAPPLPADAALWKGGAVVMLALGVLFPLAGAVLVAAVVLDWLVLRRLPALRRLVS